MTSVEESVESSVDARRLRDSAERRPGRRRGGALWPSSETSTHGDWKAAHTGSRWSRSGASKSVPGGARGATRQSPALALALSFFTISCGRPPHPPSDRLLAAEAPSVEVIADELEVLTGRTIVRHPETFRSILGDSLANDGYVCQPRPAHVFFGAAAVGERLVHGVMPHYGFFFGPMRYRVRRRPDGWDVMVRVALDPPDERGTLELPDCTLRGALEGPVHCSGAPYASSPKTEPCPASGRFSAPATRRNVEALLAQWSREIERYWNRDAAAFGLPVRYDFDFVPSDVARARSLPVDIDLPLWPTCGRTPYFSAMRSGWSLPVIAHEVGHVLGLLDEYEAFSGIVAAYPKTPFPGAEVSRMGLSMRETTQVLPLHHYLVLRRYLCPEPVRRDPFAGLP